MTTETSISLSPRDARRNFRLGVINGAFFRIADVFMDTDMVLTWFLVQLGVSNVLIGFLSPLRFGSSFVLQLLVAGYLQRMPYKLPFYRTISIFRCTVLTSFAIMVALTPPDSPWLVPLFFAMILIYSMGAGLVGIPFMDIVSKVVPTSRRGAFFSQRNFWGGILAMLATSLITWVLSDMSGLQFPRNAAVLFGGAAIFFVLTALSWMAVKEPPGMVTKEQVLWTVQIQRGAQLLVKDAAYRIYVLVRLMILFAQWAAPFYIVYATTVLNVPAHLLGIYLGARTIAAIAANLLWGRMSDQLGNRRVIMLTALIGLFMPACALLLGMLSPSITGDGFAYAFTLVFIISGVFTSGMNIGIMNYLLDITPDDERPLYLAFNNTVFGLLQFTSAIGGVLVDWLGFSAVFAFSVGCFVLALVFASQMPEPRTTILSPKN